tara:strand:+ start:100 stop:369 length:270 start_codon:yes stop_codon:yes gene_type:complete
MTAEDIKALVKRYEMDSGIAYDLSAEELQALLSEVGEMEPVIDAINVLNGASIEQRAADIGCRPDDFIEWDDNDIISVKDLELWASTPW